MRATALLTQQFTSINQILHDLADDLSPEELTTRILPNTNLLAFDLWHVARVRDWTVQTMARGIPELVEDPRWQGRGTLATPGIGVGLSQAQADGVARGLALADILAYADTLHAEILTWLSTLPDEELDSHPDVLKHQERHPIYLAAAMREEVPWMYQSPPMWRCLGPAIGHNRDHLAQIELIKQQMRARSN